MFDVLIGHTLSSWTFVWHFVRTFSVLLKSLFAEKKNAPHPARRLCVWPTQGAPEVLNSATILSVCTGSQGSWGTLPGAGGPSKSLGPRQAGASLSWWIVVGPVGIEKLLNSGPMTYHFLQTLVEHSCPCLLQLQLPKSKKISPDCGIHYTC